MFTKIISIPTFTEHKNKPKSHGVLKPNYTLKAVMSESVKLVLRDLVLVYEYESLFIRELDVMPSVVLRSTSAGSLDKIFHVSHLQ